MTDTSNIPFSQIKQFFGDNEYTFALTWAGADEWEKKTGRSLFYTFNVMVSAQTGFVEDVKEIIRIGLIGGGLQPSEAFSLVKRYVEQRPLSESMPVALMAMEAFLFGSADEKEPVKDNG